MNFESQSDYDTYVRMYKVKPHIPKYLKPFLIKQRKYAEDWWIETNNYRRRKGLETFERPIFEVYDIGVPS